jgi:ketosteroid isomerase-like protein
MLPMSAPAQPSLDTLRQQVWDTERAFARSMAERDFAAFGRHLSEQAIFWTGPAPLRGKAAVLEVWRRFYEGAQAPFSWEPDEVQVLADGTLAHSTGPVRDASGKLVSRFFSVWRQEAPGVWRIVLDRGGPLDEAERKAGGS